MRKENERKKYVINIICQTLFIIFALTLIIMVYVKTNNVFVLNLYSLVPIIQVYLCELLKVKIDKKMLLFILIENIVMILIFSIIFIPIMLIINSNLEIKISVIKNLLLNNKISLRIFNDIFNIILSFLLGLYIVYVIIKRNEMFNIKGIKLFASNIKEKHDFKDKAIKIIKPYFIQNNAMNIDDAKTIDILKVNFKFNKTIKNYWNYLLNLKIIKKKNNKYYYNEKNENNIKESIKIWYKVVIAIIITGVILFINSFLVNLTINKEIRNISNNRLSYNIDSSWNVVKEDYSKNSWEFYKIIEDENKENNKNVAKISVNYDYTKDDEKNNESLETTKKILENYLANFYKEGNYRITSYIGKKDCGIIEVMLKENDYNEYNYYICKNGKMAIITAMVNSNKQNVLEELKKESKEIAESFYWK